MGQAAPPDRIKVGALLFKVFLSRTDFNGTIFPAGWAAAWQILFVLQGVLPGSGLIVTIYLCKKLPFLYRA